MTGHVYLHNVLMDELTASEHEDFVSQQDELHLTGSSPCGLHLTGSSLCGLHLTGSSL